MAKRFLMVLCLLLMGATHPDDGSSGSERKASATQGIYQNMELERVIDGDTFIASGKRIRLWGINAPEKNKPFFVLSTKFLRALIAEGQLRCKFLYVDPFKRDVMHCSIDGVDVGSAMTRWGMATDFKKYSKGFYDDDQEIAKSKKLGIWSAR